MDVGADLARSNHHLAVQACLYCKQRKRKCDKTLPTCSLCELKGIICDYSIPATSALGSGAPSIGSNVPEANEETFTSFLFLDSTFHSHMGLQVPKVDIPLSQEIVFFIGDPVAVADEYFRSTQHWLPLFCRKQFYNDIIGSKNSLPAELLLLLASMKIISWHPTGDEHAKTPPYLAAKRSLLEAEMKGLLSLSVLQAMIILTMYEIGHAVYPAAYLSIGACARYGLALGIDSANVTDLGGNILSPLEQEGRRRAWWEILVLDRYMKLGCPDRALSTKDPGPDDLLPADDEDWDRGVVDPQQLFSAAAPADVRMGAFARLAQSTYLLSRVFVWRAETSGDQAFKEEQRRQLDRTLHSLINLSLYEGQVRRMTVCAQTAISYSALITLHLPGFADSDVSVKPLTREFHEAMTILKPAAQVTSLKSRAFLLGATGPTPLLQTSPLLLQWAYLAASIYGRIVQTSGVDEELGPLDILKTKLRVMSERWLVARDYLKILDAKEAIMSQSMP